jgi:hypothetical protein
VAVAQGKPLRITIYQIFERKPVIIGFLFFMKIINPGITFFEYFYGFEVNFFLKRKSDNSFTKMKKMKWMFAASFLLAISVCAMGQRRAYQKAPEDWAREQIGLMEQNLELSSAQKEKLYAAHLDFATRSKALREDEAIERGMLRDTMQALRAENDQLLQTYLTEEQWSKWLEAKEELLKQRFQQNKVKETSKG